MYFWCSVLQVASHNFFNAVMLIIKGMQTARRVDGYSRNVPIHCVNKLFISFFYFSINWVFYAVLLRPFCMCWSVVSLTVECFTILSLPSLPSHAWTTRRTVDVRFQAEAKIFVYSTTCLDHLFILSVNFLVSVTVPIVVKDKKSNPDSSVLMSCSGKTKGRKRCCLIRETRAVADTTTLTLLTFQCPV
jgi:hypothetical protein